MIVYFTPKKMI